MTEKIENNSIWSVSMFQLQSPVVGVVACPVDGAHLAADSKNHQEKSNTSCHLSDDQSGETGGDFKGWLGNYREGLKVHVLSSVALPFRF